MILVATSFSVSEDVQSQPIATPGVDFFKYSHLETFVNIVEPKTSHIYNFDNKVC